MLRYQQKLNIQLTFKIKYKICLSLHNNGSNIFLFINATKIYQFKSNGFEIKKYPYLCLGNISNDIKSINKKKTGLNEYVLELFVDDEIIDISNIIDIHKYLMKKHDKK